MIHSRNVNYETEEENHISNNINNSKNYKLCSIIKICKINIIIQYICKYICKSYNICK